MTDNNPRYSGWSAPAPAPIGPDKASDPFGPDDTRMTDDNNPDSPHWRERIDQIMDNFDFARVLRTMEALEWTWRDQPVDEPDLRKEARRRLREVIAAGNNRISGCGGFRAQRMDPNLRLAFEVAEWEAED